MSKSIVKRAIITPDKHFPLADKKAINELNLKVETESELMTYCDFFKNVAA